MNYSMQGMTKTIPELFVMLKSMKVEIKKENQVLMETNQTLTDSMHALARKISHIRTAIKDESTTKEDLYDTFITKEKPFDIVGEIYSWVDF